MQFPYYTSILVSFIISMNVTVDRSSYDTCNKGCFDPMLL